MFDLIQEFNRYYQNNPTLVTKALSTVAGVGGGLIPENLEKIISNTIQRLSPELALMDSVKIEGNVHSYNQLTTLPARNSAIGESATTPESNSTYTRKTVNLKEYRRKGKVTDFLQDASTKYIDAVAAEFENELLQMVYDLVNVNTFGNADANAYEHDGWEKLISTNHHNEKVGGTAVASLKTFDDMIDATNRQGGASHRRMFIMSPEMLSAFSRLLTNVRLNNGLTTSGLTQINVNGGWRLNAYRDIPIIESTSMRPVETTNCGTITIDSNGTGSLSNGTYYIQISAITPFGEQLATAEQSITLSGGTSAQNIRISFAHAHYDANGIETAYKYRIYGSTVSGAEKLLDIVSAFVYDGTGTPDTGQNGVSTNYIYIKSMTAVALTVPASLSSDVPLNSTGSVAPENIALIDLHSYQGLGKLVYTNQGGSQFNGLITTEPLAKTDAFRQFLMRSDCAIVPSFEKTSFWTRGWRVA